MALSQQTAQNYDVRLGISALKGRSVMMDSVLLALVILADAAWTIYLVERGLAIEANPLVANILAAGPALFVAVKLLYMLPLIMICEWMRAFKPFFAHAAVRSTLFIYVAVYVIGELKLHGLI